MAREKKRVADSISDGQITERVVRFFNMLGINYYKTRNVLQWVLIQLWELPSSAIHCRFDTLQFVAFRTIEAISTSIIMWMEYPNWFPPVAMVTDWMNSQVNEQNKILGVMIGWNLDLNLTLMPRGWKFKQCKLERIAFQVFFLTNTEEPDKHRSRL